MIQIGKDKGRILVFEPTYKCNYKCEYCLQTDKTLHNKKYLETAKVIRDVVVPTYRPDRIETLGGEISILDPELCKIISESNPNNYFHFITNGSNLDWFLPMVKKNRNYELTISIHESQVDVDSLIDNIEKYRNLGLKLTFSMILTKYNSEVVRYVKKIMNNKYGIKLFVLKERGTKIEDLDYCLLSEKIIFNSETHEIEKNNLSYIGIPCKCKSNILRINSEGYLCKCFVKKLSDKKITEYSNDEIKEIITNYINNPIIDCDSACHPCYTSLVQYFEGK